MNDESCRDSGLRAALVTGRIAAPGGVDGESTIRVAALVAALSEHGIPGFEVDVLGPADLIGAMAARRYDVVHIPAPEHAGTAVLRVARAAGAPVAAACDADDVASMPRDFWHECQIVLTRSRATDGALLGLGVSRDRIACWRPGVDVGQFNPGRYAPDILPGQGRFHVLYSGPFEGDPGVELLAESFLIAHDRHPRLHLVLAVAGADAVAGTCAVIGAGAPALAARVGSAATLVSTDGEDRLAQLFASADLFVCAGAAEVAGRGIAEAHASGLPVLAVESALAAELVENGRSGLIIPPEPVAFAGAMRWLARRGRVCERLATGGLLVVRERAWDHALCRLGDCWRGAIARQRLGAELEIDRAA